MGFIHGGMGENMRGIILMIRKQVWELTRGQMVGDMKENGNKENSKFHINLNLKAWQREIYFGRWKDQNWIMGEREKNKMVGWGR